MNDRGGRHDETLMLWVDAVGGYWVCLADTVMLGQPGIGGAAADVPILADLSARHARVRRDAEGYLIEALRDVRVDGRVVPQVAALHNGCRIELGGNVRFWFRRPHALSGTARLDYASPHRTQPTSDAVILMADSLVLGPKPYSHIVCRDWTQEVIIYRHDDALYCRCGAGLTIDGVSTRDRGPLRNNSRVAGDGFSFSLEVIERD